MQTGLFEILATQPAVYIGLCVALGLLIGSFLNVVIYRVPVMMDNALRFECASLADPNAEPPPAFNLLTPRSRLGRNLSPCRSRFVCLGV